MSNSYLGIRRLRVMRNGQPVYDEGFHKGLNIIRGENGSGKSTIADFIFYVLGGEFDRWKPMARLCSEVQAEVETANGVLTIKRVIGEKLTRPEIFFGPFNESTKHGTDEWSRYSLHRVEGQDSFSQIIFRSAGIPEAKSQGTSNITMHQLLRLMYSDQKTAPGFLFRYEDWDSREMREAVGDLLCGLSVYERYDAELALRELRKLFDNKSAELSALLVGFQDEGVIANPAAIEQIIRTIADQRSQVDAQIAAVDTVIAADQNAEFLAKRTSALAAIGKANSTARSLLARIEITDLEIGELEGFLEYLEGMADKLPKAELTAQIVGALEFTHCPACLSPLAAPNDDHSCVVCGSPVDPEREQSKYLQLRMDVEFQLRESRQLLIEKVEGREDLQSQKRGIDRELRKMISEFSSHYELSSSPREAYLASRNQMAGSLDRQSEQLQRLKERALRAEALSAEKASLQARITVLTDRLATLNSSASHRRARAMTLVSSTAIHALKEDWLALRRQAEFKDPSSVTLKFADNAITVDDEMNFAESSNVIVKNAAILSLVISAALDAEFNHPRFALFDNIEDKGMEQIRSHNFQNVIRSLSANAKLPHQLIVTTSMVAPELNIDELTVGPYYTHDRKTLAFT